MINNVKAFKVLNRDNRQLWSSTAAFYHRIRYVNGRLCRPKQGENPFLFVFATQELAQGFAGPDAAIYEVRAHNVHMTNGEYMADGGDYPRGTKFCSSLRLVKRVQ